MTIEKTFERERLPFRETVAAIVVDKDGRFLLGQKTWYESDQYEFLGGGIQGGESLRAAAKREVKEETGTQGFEPISESLIVNQYDWPQEVINRYHSERGQTFRGQRQHFVFGRFNGDPDNIRLSAELKSATWVQREELEDHLKFPNQWETARRVLWELSSTGTEVYGLRPGTIETKVESLDPNLEVRVLDPAGMLRIAVADLSEQVGGSLEEYPLPRVYSSLDELQRRPPLRVAWEGLPGSPKTKDVLAKLLEGLDWYLSATHPGFLTSTLIKLYEKYLPGKEARTRLLNTPAFDMYGSIAREVEHMRAQTGNQWTGGFTGDIRVVPHIFTETTVVALNEREEDPLAKPMVIPLFDFDTQFTDNPQNELARVINTLRSNGFSGYIAKSGGGHHFMADFVIPHEPGLWQSLGLMAKLVIPESEEFNRHREFAERIYKASSRKEAQKIANEILDPEKGIPNVDSKSVADIRWCAHSLLRGFTVLRSEPFWKNQNFSEAVARIY